jgi:hypothetical protein
MPNTSRNDTQPYGKLTEFTHRLDYLINVQICCNNEGLWCKAKLASSSSLLIDHLVSVGRPNSLKHWISCCARTMPTFIHTVCSSSKVQKCWYTEGLVVCNEADPLCLLATLVLQWLKTSETFEQLTTYDKAPSFIHSTLYISDVPDFSERLKDLRYATIWCSLSIR